MQALVVNRPKDEDFVDSKTQSLATVPSVKGAGSSSGSPSRPFSPVGDVKGGDESIRNGDDSGTIDNSAGDDIPVDPNVVVDPNDIKAETPGNSNSSVIDELSSYVFSCWEDAKREKDDSGISDRLVASLKQYKGEYDDAVLAQIRETGGTDTFRRLTTMKADALEAWIADSLMADNDKPWAIEPTPKPDLPENINKIIVDRAMNELSQTIPDLVNMPQEQVMQVAYTLGKKYRDEIGESVNEEAKASAKRMEKVIEDQLLEGGWNEAFDEFKNDFVVFPAAFLWGPYMKYKSVLTYEKDVATGKTVVKKTEKPVLTYSRVSPFDIYPAPKSEKIDDGYLIHRFWVSRSDLEGYKKLEGFNKEAIDEILLDDSGAVEKGDSGVYTDDNDTERRDAENKSENIYKTSKNSFEGIFFYGTVQGSMLKSWGMEPDSETDIYDVTCTMVGKKVIKAVINDDVIYQRPYSKASFKNVPGSFWGTSLPEAMGDIQRQCNAVIRGLCNNIAISSGPFMSVDLSMFPANFKLTKLRPWMLFPYNGSMAPNNRQPVSIEQINCNANQLLPVYSSFKAEADDVTNVPAFFYGNAGVGGAGQTASGLSMLQNNAMKGIRKITSEIGKCAIKPVVYRTFMWNMLYNPDESIKGDICVAVKGPLSVTTKEVRMLRLNEFFQRVSDPGIINIIGIPRFINILREIARSLEMPLDEIVPSRREIEMLMAQQAAEQAMAIQEQQAATVAMASKNRQPASDSGGQPQNTETQRASIPTVRSGEA